MTEPHHLICANLSFGNLCVQSFPSQHILDSSILEEFADNNFKFDENRSKVSQWEGRKQCGKRRNCSLAISPFPTVFSKDLFCRQVKRSLFGKGLNWTNLRSLYNIEFRVIVNIAELRLDIDQRIISINHCKLFRFPVK